MKKVLGLIIIGLLISFMLCPLCPVQEKGTALADKVLSSAFAEAGATHWWDKFGEPKYGGTITIPVNGLDNVTLDPFSPMGTNILYHFEPIFGYDWTLEPDIWTYSGGWVPPEYYTGVLAESWEQKDPNSIIVRIHKGVHWQDKAPVNGREFTADDIVWNVDRLLGIGSGYTQPVFFMAPGYSTIERAVAVDKYTVKFQLKKPSAIAVIQIVGNGWGWAAPEWGALDPPSKSEGPPKGGPPGPPGPKKSGSPGPPGLMGAGAGPLGDWKNAVGTGPWILTDFMRGSWVTYEKNPDYWGFDERHPGNKLPYGDTLKILSITDTATMLSALRTGKLDAIPTLTLSWQQSRSMAKTNPEIHQALVPLSGVSIDVRCDREPFSDIRVRKALQMSIDRKTIAATHYGGAVSGTPAGIMSSRYEGWVLPYNEWPEQLQKEYSYNPEGARVLLAEAGYPNGFKTNIVASTTHDIELLQIVKGYFNDIGVDMEIRVMDMAMWMSVAGAGKSDQMTYGAVTGLLQAPQQAMWQRSKSCPFNYTFYVDPEYDRLYESIFDAKTEAEAKEAVIKADQKVLTLHQGVYVCSEVAGYYMWQPWLKGYNGEGGPPPPGGSPTAAWLLARSWIDLDSKK